MVQTAYATEPTDGLTELPISCKILDMKYSIGDKHKVLRGFDEPNACHLLTQCSDITLHLEYIPQADDTLLAYLVNRTAEMKLTPLAFVLETNTYNTTVANKSSYLFWGCKCKNVNIAASINNEYIISADFSVKQSKSVNNSLSSLAAWTMPAALTGAYLAFNIAGTIVKTGGATAYLTESISIDINHNTTDKYDHDSLIKQYCIEGAYDITGSMDISLDEGGRVYTNEILDQTEFTLIVTMGGAGSPIITIPGCKWRTGGVDVNISGDILVDSASFTGKPTDGVLDTIVT